MISSNAKSNNSMHAKHALEIKKAAKETVGNVEKLILGDNSYKSNININDDKN